MDVSTYPDLDLTGRWITEDESILECLRRALEQSPTKLDYAPDSGWPLLTLLSRAVDTRRIYQFEDAIEAQALRDERVSKATVDLSYVDERLSGTIVLVKSDATTLRLTVEATSLSLELLRS